MNKKGMTLITLVIVIIIMIILASVVIISLSNSDIVNKAKIATNDFNLKNIQQLANMAYANVYFDNLTKGIRRELTEEEIRKRMIDDGTKKEDLDCYDIKVEKGDVFVSIKEQST